MTTAFLITLYFPIQLCSRIFLGLPVKLTSRKFVHLIICGFRRNGCVSIPKEQLKPRISTVSEVYMNRSPVRRLRPSVGLLSSAPLFTVVLNIFFCFEATTFFRAPNRTAITHCHLKSAAEKAFFLLI